MSALHLSFFSFYFFLLLLGMFNGAAVLLEELLLHPVLFLACRHHIMELILEAVYTALLNPSGGPDIIFFKRFQQKWQCIDPTKFANGLSEQETIRALGCEIDEIIQFATDQIKVTTPRSFLHLFCLNGFITFISILLYSHICA